jgi:hypothetical protein
MPLHFGDLGWLVQVVVAIFFLAIACATIRNKIGDEQQLQRALEPKEEDPNYRPTAMAVTSKKGQ